jgi:hypothetical protein
MSFLSIIFAILVTGASLVLLLFLLQAILSPLVGNPLKFSEKWKMKKRARLLGEVERLLEEGTTDGASRYLRQCFYLEHVYRNPDLIPVVGTHNLSILGSILTLADKQSAHIPNLGTVEELLTDRIQMMKNYLETMETKRELSRKRKQEGRDVPGWASKEYNKKVKELKERILTNHNSLNKEIDQLFRSLDGAAQEKEATYH